jgi:hypothetical protein
MSWVETEAREQGRHFDYSVRSALGLWGVVAPFFEIAKPFVKRAATVREFLLAELGRVS